VSELDKACLRARGARPFATRCGAGAEEESLRPEPGSLDAGAEKPRAMGEEVQGEDLPLSDGRRREETLRKPGGRRNIERRTLNVETSKRRISTRCPSSSISMRS
jgi:hypothetical protein